jgi:ubiquinone/menaquinone biosynthesis C-methylase UbiE
LSIEKDGVKIQFGKTASQYVESAIHAKGKDLGWLVQVIQERLSQPLLALDIATGTGHTAFALRGCVPRVVGLDLTEEMIHQAKQEAGKRGLDNLTWMIGDAEAIPLPDRLFDVVTCRIAAHHFPDPLEAFQESYRVLQEGGLFILVDNVAPDDPDLDRLYNQVEALRDPSHGRVYTESKWSDWLQRAGFSSVEVRHRWENRMEMGVWFDRANTSEQAREQAWQSLVNARPEQQQILGFNPDKGIWTLRKAMWLAEK